MKIKPVKINEKVINQLDFLFGKPFGDDVRQVIFDNFNFGKLVNIYFHVREGQNSLGPKFELEDDRTKLVISPLDLKNQFHDYS